VSEDEINEVQRKSNDRPRKALNFNKPDEAFNNVVALEVWNHNLINTLKNAD
jgi:IS30 family transposase